MGFFKKKPPENKFDAFQKRVGIFVALPNGVISVALLIIVIVTHIVLPSSDASSIIIVGFAVYAIVFFILYTRKPFLNTSKSSVDLFQQMQYEELSMLIIFINKFGKIFVGLIVPLFAFYVFLLIMNTLIDMGYFGENVDPDASSPLLSGFFYTMLIPIVGGFNILFFRLFLSSYVDYNFQFSRGCMQIILKYPEIFDDALAYMIKESISSYDLFLRRYTKFGFRDKNQIYSQLILKSRKNLFAFLYDYVKTFTDDTFSPAKIIAKSMLESSVKDILIENNMLHKIKDYSSIFIIFIVAISSIISFLFYSGILQPL